MRDAALAHVERWLRELEDSDRDQREWKLTYAHAAVRAYEHIGMLDSDEATRWRDRFSDDGARRPSVAGELDDSARAAGVHHLAELVERVRPLRRQPDPDNVARLTQCSVAIDALRAVGALDDDEETQWR